MSMHTPPEPPADGDDDAVAAAAPEQDADVEQPQPEAEPVAVRTIEVPVALPDDIDEIVRAPFDRSVVPALPMTPRDQLETDLVMLRARSEAADRRALDALEEAHELRLLVTAARADIARLEVTVEALSDALARARADLEAAEELAGLH